jgi:ferredoxin
MNEKKDEIVLAFKKMMKDSGKIAQKSPIFHKDIKDFEGEVKIQWKICGIYGFQIFEQDNYQYKIGEKLEEPDLLIRISRNHPDLAIRFLKGESMGFSYAPRRDYKGKFKVDYVEGYKIIKTEKGERKQRISKRFITAQAKNEKFKHPFNLLKLPPFQRGLEMKSEDDYGAYIPINKSLGTFESKVIPYKVFEYFIEKASNIVMMNYCGCRKFNECQDHDISLGCVYMGDDTFQMKIIKNRGRVATKEEALERVRLAIEDGLIPLLGRAMVEARGYGVTDTGHFLSSCFCCSCCCINGKILSYGPNANLTMFSKIEGVTVNIDEDVCKGCGKCIEVCVFKGRKLIDEKAKIDIDRCLGCGRCADVCPSGATTIKIDDMDHVEELINKIESHVDVTNQSNS